MCGRWAATILTDTLPRLVRASLCFAALDAASLTRHVKSVRHVLLGFAEPCCRLNVRLCAG